MINNLRILHVVELYHPSVGGMQEVARQLSERISSKGHTVEIATKFLPGTKEKETINGITVNRFHLSGNYVEGIIGDENEKQRFLDFVKQGQFDIITIMAAQQCLCDLLLPVLTELPGRKIFVPTGFSGLHSPSYSDYFEKMKVWMKNFDMNVFLSDTYQDIEFARKAGIEKITVIPNGASEEEFSGPVLNIRQKTGIRDDEFLILHVGSYTGIKGHREAVRIFSRSDISNGVLLMTGNENDRFKKHFNNHYSYFIERWLIRLKRKKIKIVSLNREETVSAFRESDVFLFPSNLECSPLVLFESLAAGIPFLSSSAGNAREITDWSGGGLILPSEKSINGKVRTNISASVKMLEKFAADKILREKLKTKGKENFLSKFTWKNIAEKYESLYKSVLSR